MSASNTRPVTGSRPSAHSKASADTARRIRAGLLGSTALIAAALAVSPALAQTVVSPAGGGTVTRVGGSSPTVNDQSGSGGGVQITNVTQATQINVNGVTIDNTTGAPSVDALRIQGSTSGLNSTGVTLTGVNTLTTTADGGAGLYVSTNANVGVGITSSGSTFTGSYGINIQALAGYVSFDASNQSQSFVANGTHIAGFNAVTGVNASIQLGSSTITGFDTGINASNFYGSYVQMTGGSINALITGIRTDATGGGSTIESQAAIVAPTGIHSTNTDGTTITTSGAGTINSTVAGTGTGIIATSSGGTTAVTVNVGAAIGGVTAFGAGVTASTTGASTGAINITTTAEIVATGRAISATAGTFANTGTINVGGNITGATGVYTNIGAYAVNIGAGVTVTSTGAGASNAALYLVNGFNTVTNNGALVASGAGSYGVRFSSDGLTTNTATGTISGSSGVYHQNSASLTNAGTITGTGVAAFDAGVRSSGGTYNNTGTITGNTGLFNTGNIFTVNNTGAGAAITGALNAINVSGGALNLTNTGVIQTAGGTGGAGLAGVYVNSTATFQNQQIANTGTISGGGDAAHGFGVDVDDGILVLTNNAGGVITGGTGAIRLSSADLATVTLAVGSTVTGDILSDDTGARTLTVNGALNGDYVGGTGSGAVAFTLGATGAMQGAMLGTANDTFTYQGGTFGAPISGGTGSDSFLVGLATGATSRSLAQSEMADFETYRLMTGTLTLTGSRDGGPGWVVDGGAATSMRLNGSLTNVAGSAFTLTAADLLTIMAGSQVSATGDVIFSTASGNSVINSGTITSGSAAVSGVRFGSGTVNNTGTITYSGGAATTAGYGVHATSNNLTIDNAAAASITGRWAGVRAEAGAVILNSGRLQGDRFAGVEINTVSASTVTNNSGGVIYGATAEGSGLLINAGAVSVTNSSGGLIVGAGEGAIWNRGAGTLTVTNAGTLGLGTVDGSGVFTASGTGVALRTSGALVLTNQAGGLITGSLGGVQATASGSITNAGAIVGSGAGGYGVSMAAGGSIANLSGGSITGVAGGVLLSGTNAFNLDLRAGSVTGLVASSASGTVAATIAGSLTGAYAANGSGVDLITLASTGSMTGATLGAGADVFTYQGGGFSGVIDAGTGADSLISNLSGGSASVNLSNLTAFETFAHQSGTLTLTGTGAFSGGSTVQGGALAVDGTLQSAVSVANGADLHGGGSITGAVTVADGGALSGAQGTTLTMGSLGLSSGSTINATFSGTGGSALFDVAGDLTLDGTINVASTGAYGLGVYGLMTYGGVLTDNGLMVGATPGGAARTLVQTSVAGQVNIVHAPTELLFWDGGNVGQHDDGAVNGGSGTWTAAGSEWTDTNGQSNGAMEPQPGFAIFQGVGGVVTVDDGAGAVSVTGMQFAADGYRIEGDAVTLANADTTIRVGDGTAPSAAWTATIASELTGAGGLVKTDLGTLILTGENTFSGGVTVNAGALQIGDGGAVGSIVGSAVLANDATLVFSRNDNHDFANAVSGSGSVGVRGMVTLSGAITASGGVDVYAGGAATLSNVSVASGAAVSLAADADLTVASGGAIASANGNGVFGTGGNSVVNLGAIQSNDLTVRLGTGASLDNAGSITTTGSGRAVYFDGAGTIVNRAGSVIAAAGTTNQSYGVTILGAGSVTNSGLISAGFTGVALLGGGTLTNQSGGEIRGVNGVLASTLASVINAGNATITATTGNAVRMVASGSSLTNAGVISGASIFSGVYFDGTGTVTNQAGGSISNTASAVQFFGAGSVLNNAGSISNANTNSAVYFNNSGTVTNQATGTIASANGYGVQLAGANSSVANLGSITARLRGVSLDGANSTLTNSGSISGATGAVIATGGQVTNAGAITGLNGAGVRLTGGGSVDNLAGGSVSGTGGAILSVGSFVDIVTLRDGSTISGGIWLAGGDDTLTLYAGAETSGLIDGGDDVDAFVVAGAGSSSFDIGNLVNFESRAMNGAGTFTLTGADVSTVAWDVNSGVLAVSGESAVNDAATVNVASGATLALLNDERIGALNGAGSVSLGDNTLILAGTSGFSGVASGAGGLMIEGGTVTLSGANTYTGATSVLGGTLTLGASDVLSDETLLFVETGATLNLQGFTDTVRAALLNGTLSGTGTLTAAQYQLNGATVNANLGAGTLFTLGGISTLNGTAAAEGVSLNAGTLRLGASERLSDTATVSVATGATFALNGFDERIGALFGTGDVDVGAGRLTFGGIDSGFGGRLSGAGSLVHTGGLFTLMGEHTIRTISNTGGELRFLGATTGALSVSGGSLTGAGTIGGALTASNGAVVSPGLAGIQNGVGGFTAGGLTLNGATLAIDVLGRSGGSLIDQLRINGTATLTGGLLAPTFQGPATDFDFSTRYLFLQANTLVGTFANGADFTASGQEGLFWRVRYDLAPNAAVLELRELTDFDPGETGTGNQRSVGQALSNGQLEASDDFGGILSLLAGLNAEDRAAAFDSISGEPLADMTTSLFSANGSFLTAVRDGGLGGRDDGGEALNFASRMSFSSGRDSVADRMGDVLGAFDPSASVARGAGGWVTAYTADQTLDGKAGTADVDSRLNGLAGGYGVRNGSMSLGAAGGVSRLEGDVVARQARYESDLSHGAAYIAFDDGVWAADVTAAFYGGELDSRRGVQVGAFRGQAIGDTHAEGQALSASVARRFQVTVNTMIALGAIGTASNASVDGFTETGAGGLSLQASGLERDWQSLQVSARAVQDYRVNGRRFQIYAGAGVMATTGDRQATGDMRFSGAPTGFGAFTVEGAETPPVAGVADFGLEVGVGDGVTLSGGYRGVFSDRLRDNQVGLKLRVNW